jgi:hypothetical protein
VKEMPRPISPLDSGSLAGIARYLDRGPSLRRASRVTEALPEGVEMSAA